MKSSHGSCLPHRCESEGAARHPGWWGARAAPRIVEQVALSTSERQGGGEESYFPAQRAQKRVPRGSWWRNTRARSPEQEKFTVTEARGRMGVSGHAVQQAQVTLSSVCAVRQVVMAQVGGAEGHT